MIIAEKNLHFVHVPKTGGTYIEIYLLKHLYGEAIVNTKNWRSFMGKYLYSDHARNNPYHVPMSALNSEKKYESLENFCILRDPYEIRLSSYNWLINNRSYRKPFDAYIQSYDFINLPNDNGTRVSTFGLRQIDYINTNKKVRVFLFRDFDKILDYIDSIFCKSISRFKKVNTGGGAKIFMSDKSKEIIYRYFQQDFEFLEKLSG